jgi:aerobic-type carbon monoxide dehydrogenase small subunit (CoxS/CutS family)
MSTDIHKITLKVNGTEHTVDVAARRHLADVLREELGLTGTHLGCEHGVCGACTVAVDGEATRACLVLAVQVDGSEITTIEGLTEADGTMGLIQRAMWEKHAFQCAFCAPGFMMSMSTMLAENPTPTREEIKEGLSGNLCRCTGYHSILEGATEAVSMLAEQRASSGGASNDVNGAASA